MWILFQGCISKMQLAYIQTVYAIQYICICLLRYLMEQLRKLCEAALVSGVRVTRENLFDLARWWSWWSSMMMIVEKKMMIARMNQACRRVLLPSTCGWDFAHQVLEILEVLIFCSWTCLFHRLLLMSMCQYLRQQCFVLFWSHTSPY